MKLNPKKGNGGHITAYLTVIGSKEEAYSVEELVAEIGAASLCATLGIDTISSMQNAAAYIQSWMKAIKHDKRMFIIAAARAEKAIRLVLNITEEGDE